MNKHTVFISFCLLITGCLFGQTSGVDQLALMTNRQSMPQEKVNGVKPVLASPSEGWTPLIRQNMNEIWKSIHLEGCNYYAMGKATAENSFSERSNFRSPFYQAWFGTYVIDAKKQLFDFPNDEINSNKKQVIDKLIEIGILDQSSWLYAMGDPGAFQSTSLTDSANNYMVTDHLTIDGISAPVIVFSLNSHSDLNDSTTRLSGLIGKPANDYWHPALNGNHAVTLTGFYIYWYNKADQTLKIIYGTGCSFRTKDNATVNTYPALKEGMFSMAKRVKYVSAN